VLAVASELDLLTFFFAVFAAILAVLAAFLDHTTAGWMRALVRIRHGQPSSRSLLPACFQWMKLPITDGLTW